MVLYYNEYMKNAMLKYVVFDLDNTLLDSRKNVSRYSLDCLKKFKKDHNVRMGVASGRTRNSYRNAAEKNGLDEIMDFLILNDGVDIYDLEDDVHVEFPFLDYEEVKQIYHIFIQYDFINVIFFGDHNMYARKSDDDLTYYMRRQGVTNFSKVSMDMIGNIKRCVVVFDREHNSEVRKIRNENPVAGVRYCFSEGHLLDVMPETISKSRAMEHYLKTKNDSWDNVMFFGDSENDLDLITLSGYGIAMKNGEETVRRQRKYVTEHGCDEDGCARFLEKWGK